MAEVSAKDYTEQVALDLKEQIVHKVKIGERFS